MSPPTLRQLPRGSPSTNGHAVTSAFAAKLLQADMILIAGGYPDAGKQMLGSGAWATSALLLDVASAGNGTLSGDGGADILIGQRGNDVINGGDDDDTLRRQGDQHRQHWY